MSFRRFVYYCAVWGAWSAFVGWTLGRLLAPATAETAEGTAGSALSQDLLRTGILGLFLGLTVALGLSVLDARLNLSLRRVGLVALRVGTAVLVGSLGGLLGAC